MRRHDLIEDSSARFHFTDDLLGGFRSRDHVPTQRFWQTTDQGNDLFLEQARHQPTRLSIIQLAYTFDRDSDRRPIITRPRFKSILHRNLHRSHGYAIGERLLGIVVIQTGQQVSSNHLPARLHLRIRFDVLLQTGRIRGVIG